MNKIVLIVKTENVSSSVQRKFIKIDHRLSHKENIDKLKKGKRWAIFSDHNAVRVEISSKTRLHQASTIIT